MEQSILTSTKKILNIEPDDTSFDVDVLTHINSAFSTLTQLGVGPVVFIIEDDTPQWHSFIPDDDTLLSMVKVYVYLKVRMLWDPPTTAHMITAFKEQLLEHETRINVYREGMVANG